MLYPADLEALLLAADARGLRQALVDAAFHAKFSMKTQDLMRRIGPGTDGFDNLAAEFQSSVEKASLLIRAIVKEAGDQTKTLFTEKFFASDRDGLSSLLGLFSDLAWIKNWENDGKEIPLTK